MTKGEKYPAWLLWLWDKGFLFGLAISLIALVVVLILVYHVDERLEGIEEKLAYEPPRRYESPDLDAYAAEDIPAQSIATERAVYVPVYSHVYYHQGRPYLLEATLSIRNTDRTRPIYVRSVRYYNTKGELVKTHVDRVIRLAPLETIEFLVESKDASGGSGANFVVEWLATESVDEPMIEAIMVGASGTQGISFRAAGKTLDSSALEGR